MRSRLHGLSHLQIPQGRNAARVRRWLSAVEIRD